MRTIRSGIDPAGHRLDTFMPRPRHRRVTDDDLRAIHRYLRTVPPVRREVPRRAPPTSPPSDS